MSCLMRRDWLAPIDLPGEVVWLIRDKRNRKGRYRLAGLIERHGVDAKLTDLRLEIAQETDFAPAIGRTVVGTPHCRNQRRPSC
jgi:hypothetical protein